MKIVTYNLQQGGMGSVHWGRIIERFDPALLLVQESSPPHEHLPALAAAELRTRAFWAPAEGRAWGSGLYVNRGIVRPLTLGGFMGWLAGAEIEGSGGLGPRPGRSVPSACTPPGTPPTPPIRRRSTRCWT
jgi:hypothetical protein